MIALSRTLPHIKEACLWLKTPNIREVKIFYEKINRLISLTQRRLPAITSNNIKVIFSSSNSAQTGLAFIAEESLEEELQDPDGRPLSFYKETDNEEVQHLTCDIANIFRCRSIEISKKFYEPYGKWTEEKHQNGPRHYSVDWNGIFTELYPERKIKSSPTEFIFQISNINNVYLKIQESNLVVHSHDEKHISLFDPDGRLIKFIP